MSIFVIVLIPNEKQDLFGIYISVNKNNTGKVSSTKINSVQ